MNLLHGNPLHGLLAYRMFVSPLPVWDYWYVLLIPLCLAVAIVYKAVRLESMKHVPLQALGITCWIIGGMALAAAALTVIVKLL